VEEYEFMMKMCFVLCTLVAVFSGDVSDPLARRYQEGQKITYRMKGINEAWHYEVQADGVVKKDADGTYFEEVGWSQMISDGKPFTLPPASLSFQQILTLDPKHKPSFPNISQVDPRLVGPLTDMLTFYVDVSLAEKTGKLEQPGDHFYLKRGKPASWADGVFVLIGESSIDFDFTLKSIDQANKTVMLLARHVPPERPEVRLVADWMQKPVADTPNNWVQIRKTRDAKYLVSVGKETFTDEIVLSLADGKILSANMDNVVETVERECTDQAASQCGDPSRHTIRRQIQVALVK
jgi:hypothetical protein